MNGWCDRGKMTESDLLFCKAFLKEDLLAGRLLLTGEADFSYLGPLSDSWQNLDEWFVGRGEAPIIAETKDGTLRMVRYSASEVWGCFDKDDFERNLHDEATRLGVKNLVVQYPDFYYSMALSMTDNGSCPMFPVIGKKGDLEYLNQAAYLGCILLFQKPGFLGEDAAHHFAQKKASDFMLDAEIDELSPDEYREWEEIDEKYADIKALTNKEVQFALELLEKRARRIR